MTTVANESGASKRRAAVVYNPTKVELGALQRVVAEAEQTNGWAPSLFLETGVIDFGRSSTREAIAAGVDVVIAIGGDGTVRAIAGELHDSGVALGIVPKGTGNLLARTLDLPLNNVTEAIDIAFGPNEQPVDLIEMTTDHNSVHPSVVLSGVGIDAEMIDATSDQLKARVGWLAYLNGLARALPKVRPFKVQISVDGSAPQPHKVTAVMFANLADLPGNVSLAPDSSIADGRLDLVIVQPRHLLDWIWIWRRFSFENAVLMRTPFGRRMAARVKGRNRSQVLHLQCHDVELWMSEGPRAVQVDGDAVGHASHVRADMKPHSLRVKVTADVAATALR